MVVCTIQKEGHVTLCEVECSGQESGAGHVRLCI